MEEKRLSSKHKTWNVKTQTLRSRTILTPYSEGEEWDPSPTIWQGLTGSEGVPSRNCREMMASRDPRPRRASSQEEDGKMTFQSCKFLRKLALQIPFLRKLLENMLQQNEGTSQEREKQEV